MTHANAVLMRAMNVDQYHEPEASLSFRRIRSWIQWRVPPLDRVHHLAVDQLREVEVIALRHAGHAAAADFLRLLDHVADVHVIDDRCAYSDCTPMP